MAIHWETHPMKDVVRKVFLFFTLAVGISGFFVATAYAQVVPIPSEIKDLKMGSSTAQVVDIIKDAGTHSTVPILKENRTELIWVPTESPYYKDVTFRFTEKDRLCLIRFAIKDAARTNYHSLKKAVFDEFDFSWERPSKLRIKNQDVMLYGPEKGMDLYFFEFTDKDTNEKKFELFDRSVSATDRPSNEERQKQREEELKRAEGDQQQKDAAQPVAESKPLENPKGDVAHAAELDTKKDAVKTPEEQK